MLYGEYDNTGALIREYVYLNGQPLAQINAGAPETITYLHADHLGTPRYGTNSSGTQVWAWSGDAFGVGTPSGAATVNIRMPGQYADAESGLFYNWNRYYNPAIGRYISSDPIGIDGGLNTFLYAEASPVMYTDPTGEFFWLPFLGTLAVGTLYALPANAPSSSDEEVRESPLMPYVAALETGVIIASASKQVVSKTIQQCKIHAKGTLKSFFSPDSILFKRNGGLLNNNPYFRIGWNWKGSRVSGKPVFRIAIGNKKTRIHWHKDFE